MGESKFEEVSGGIEVSADDGAIRQRVPAFRQSLPAHFPRDAVGLGGLVRAGVHFEDEAASFFRFAAQHRVEHARRGGQYLTVESTLVGSAMGGHGTRGQVLHGDDASGADQSGRDLVEVIQSLATHLLVQGCDARLGLRPASGAALASGKGALPGPQFLEGLAQVPGVGDLLVGAIVVCERGEGLHAPVQTGHGLAFALTLQVRCLQIERDGEVPLSCPLDHLAGLRSRERKAGLSTQAHTPNAEEPNRLRTWLQTPAVAMLLVAEPREPVLGFEPGKPGCLTGLHAAEEVLEGQIQALERTLGGVRMNGLPCGVACSLRGEMPALVCERSGKAPFLVQPTTRGERPVVDPAALFRLLRNGQRLRFARIQPELAFALDGHGTN